MNQLLKKEEIYSFNTEQNSIERILNLMVAQNDLIIDKLSTKVDDQILKAYYDYYDGTNEMRKFIHTLDQGDKV